MIIVLVIVQFILLILLGYKCVFWMNLANDTVGEARLLYDMEEHHEHLGLMKDILAKAYKYDELVSYIDEEIRREKQHTTRFKTRKLLTLEELKGKL